MNPKIKQYLDTASAAYYAGNPFISDEQFDKLAEAVGYNEVGTKQHEDVVKHVYQLYSLQKHYEDEGKESPLANERNVCMSPKIDGAAISALYIDRQLTQVTTRGDGVEGKDVTAKFLATKVIPHTIALDGVIQVIGEIAAPKTVENARNYAAGSLNLKDIEEFKTRAVEFFAYGVFPYQELTYDQDMMILRLNGFNTVQDQGIAEVYPTDGVVYRVNNNRRFDELGYTAKHPRGAYALKERAGTVETILLDVEWNVGRTGKVVPTAILEPVMIEDAKISRATLNNPGFIEALDLRLGDTVAIRRAGAIIPEIVHKVE